MALEGQELKDYLVKEAAAKAKYLSEYAGYVVWMRLKPSGQPVGGYNDYSKQHIKIKNSSFTLCGILIPEWHEIPGKKFQMNWNCKKCEKARGKSNKNEESN